MLRPATEDDAEMVLRWRNHPDVRAMSLGTDEIALEDHLRWWSAMLVDPDRRALIYEVGGHPAGVVLFTGLTGDQPAQWSFYLDVAGLEQRGHTLQAWLRSEREVLDFAFGELGLSELEGVVLARNEAMRQLHARHGFVEVGVEEVVQSGELAPPGPVGLVTVRITPGTRTR
jgi:RimJ/RimL family protein N-acetyltransferase